LFVVRLKIGSFVHLASHAMDAVSQKLMIFLSIARRLISQFGSDVRQRDTYKTGRPRSSLGYRPRVPEAIPWPVPSSGSTSLHLRLALAKEAIMR